MSRFRHRHRGTAFHHIPSVEGQRGGVIHVVRAVSIHDSHVIDEIYLCGKQVHPMRDFYKPIPSGMEICPRCEAAAEYYFDSKSPPWRVM